MYADREEALRRSQVSEIAVPPPTVTAEERERQLQEELRRRAADSRRDPRDPSGMYDTYAPSSSPDTRRASRRRGDDYDDERYSYRAPRGYDSTDGHWREDAGGRALSPSAGPRHRRGGRRHEYADDAVRSRRRSRSPPGARGSRLPPYGAEYEVKSVFCSELDSRVGQFDLGDFFEGNLGPGTVVDAQLAVDDRTGTSLGIGYVELASAELVPRALELSGKRMFGWPISVQPAEAARKNPIVTMYEPPRSTVPPSTAAIPNTSSPSLSETAFVSSSSSVSAPTGPIMPPSTHSGATVSGGDAMGASAVTADPEARLYVGNLHYDITAQHVRVVFEPFGHLDEVEVCYNHMTGKSKGFAFVQFRNVHEAKQAMEQLNGFELAGRAMRVGPVNARGQGSSERSGSGRYDVPDSDHDAVPMPPPTGGNGESSGSASDKRFALMEKLARTDPENHAQRRPASIPEATSAAILLRHMFDPAEETEPHWHVDLREDVRAECERHGTVESVFVDTSSRDGEVYVCFATTDDAQRARASLQGRFFGGKRVEASLYVS